MLMHHKGAMFRSQANPQLDLERIHVASPCSASWDEMSGNDRSRNCSQCDRTVYNISGLSRREATELIANRDGRMCIRLHRRVDGTVITNDCPKGLKAYRMRVAKYAASVFAAVLGLFSVGYGQRISTFGDSQGIRSESTVDIPRIKGTVKDQSGAVISDATVTVTTANGKSIVRKTDQKGRFSITSSLLEIGENNLRIEFPHFDTYGENFTIRRREIIDYPVTLEIMMFIGSVVELPKRTLIDIRKSEISTTIRNNY